MSSITTSLQNVHGSFCTGTFECLSTQPIAVNSQNVIILATGSIKNKLKKVSTLLTSYCVWPEALTTYRNKFFTVLTSHFIWP